MAISCPGRLAATASSSVIVCSTQLVGSVAGPARVKVRIDRHVVAKALGRSEQRFQLDLLHGLLALLAALIVNRR